ncbi:hypothetical protein ACSU1N_04975 [Thermogladius sp. 4427co]|uniref:hypothetical protein n=1 Tax=Thermogladius sp. 4427co TaxID=3450718 RepID=UPI003F79E071
MRVVRFAIYLAVGLALIIFSVIMLLLSIGYMQSGLIATSLLSALIGFTLLSSGIYVLRLSAYVFAVEKGYRVDREKTQ